MKKEELLNRTKKFAHNCVKLALQFPENDLGRHIRRQLIRCSTSVAANYRAACHAHSKDSFIAKLSIVIEEADESEFWIEFLKDGDLIRSPKVEELLDESHQLASIFISSRKTARFNKS